MPSKKPIVAIMYDFDKTLCTTDMQNYKFIPDVNMTPTTFWGATQEFGEKYQVEKILAYMYIMIKKAKENNIELSREYLNSLGKAVQYYKGVESWFKRINDYGLSQGVQIEHYVISSGTKEIIEGTSIAKEFKQIYACEFLYENGVAVWPKLTINYTQKTQFIYRIRKGVEKLSDDDSVNSFMPEEKKRVRYSDMIYIGDGMTDIPCMLHIKEKGGFSIALYSDIKKINAKKLIKDERVNVICKADYQEGSEFDDIIKTQIQKIALNHRLLDKQKKQRENAIKEMK